MTSTGRGAPRRLVTYATLARLLGLALALGAIGTPTGQAAAAADEASTFKVLDDDGDGVVTRQEFLRMKTEIFYRALKNLDQDPRLGPDDINVTPKAFADADLDGDGKLSGAEFVQARFTQFEAIVTDTGLPASEAHRYSLLGPEVIRA